LWPLAGFRRGEKVIFEKTNTREEDLNGRSPEQIKNYISGVS
jgi:hypothetical protein